MNSRPWPKTFGELLDRSLAVRFDVGITMLAFGILLLGLLWGAVIVKLHAEREAEIKSVMKNTANLARAFEEHTIRTIREADQLLLFITDLRREQGGKLDLRRFMEHGPLIDRIYTYLSIIDEHGMLAAGSAPFKPTDLSDREHFRAHVAQDTGRLFISKPVVGRASGKQSIQLSRRINKPDLSFGGVAVASIDPDYFSRFYGQLDLGKQGVVTLVGRDDATIRARRSGEDTTIGQDMRNTPLFSHLRTSEHGSYMTASAVDGVMRILSYRTLADYPLVVAVGAGADEALAVFNQRAREHYQAAALVSLVILAFTAFLLLVVSRRAKAETALREGERRLRGIIESVVEGIISVDEQQRMVIVNPAAEHIFGRAAAEMIGQPLGMLVPERYRARHDEHIRRFAATGETSRAMGRYGLIYGLRADGTEFPVEATVSQSGTSPNKLLTVILRDITERMRTEQALRDYAGQLRLLSRRLFEAEENERRRLARELHDRIGQNVTALTLSLNMVRGELTEDCRRKVNTRLDDCESLLFSTAQLVRNVMTDLRPPGLDELGLVAALSEHARQVAGRGGFSVTVNGTEVSPRLPPATEIMLFRIAQEALMNASKHARATEVSIGLDTGPDTVVLTIADNGCGFEATARLAQPTSSLGMVSMRERAESIGARLRVESAPGHGTRVIVEAPRANHISSSQPHLPGIEPA